MAHDKNRILLVIGGGIAAYKCLDLIRRAREKGFLADRGYPVTPFAKARSLDELAVGLGLVRLPAIVKTAVA